MIKINNKIINLDTCVINALELFSKTKIPKININFKKPIVIGSGNAAITGKILFSNLNCIFANESNYIEKLKIKKPDGCILISASGGKHAPIIAKEMKKKNIKTILITNNPKSKTSQLCEKTLLFPKNIEPYTYNTSTYIGMIIGKTKENPKEIYEFIKKIKIPNFKNYKSFFIIIPEKFEYSKEMLQTKFDELFGPMIQGRIFTYEQTKHAKTIINSKNELFIGIGVNNKLFGINKFNIKIPKNFKDAGFLSIAYYLIGKIQEQNPPYFKKNIKNYLEKASKIFNEKIELLN